MQAQRKSISFLGLGDIGVADQMYEYIREHPQVCAMSSPTNFFSDTAKYAKGLTWYEDHVSHSAESRVCGELAFDYLKSSQAASLIARTYSRARLLAVIDTPLLMVRVAYLEAIKVQQISNKVTLGKFLENNPQVLQSFRYGQLLHQYFGYYSQNDLLVMTRTETIEDPLKAIARVYEHLNLDKKFVPPKLIHLVPVDDEDGQKKRGKIKRLIKFVKGLVVGAYRAMVKWRVSKRKRLKTRLQVAEEIVLKPELEKALKDYYRSDVALLDHLLHRNLSYEWGFGLDDEVTGKS